MTKKDTVEMNPSCPSCGGKLYQHATRKTVSALTGASFGCDRFRAEGWRK
jgi:hypothetical protein